MTTPDPLASMTPEELIAVVTRGLNADEATAHAAARETPTDTGVHPHHWRYEQLRDGPAGEPGGYVLDIARDSIVDVGFMDDDVLRPAEAEHIARHDPGRVLADVESKRAILAEHTPARGVCRTCTEPMYDPARPLDPVPAPCLTLRSLARPYLDQETP